MALEEKLDMEKEELLDSAMDVDVEMDNEFLWDSVLDVYVVIYIYYSQVCSMPKKNSKAMA